MKRMKQQVKKIKADVLRRLALVDKSLVPVLALLVVAACSKSVEEHVHLQGSTNALVAENKQWSFSPATEADLNTAAEKAPEARAALAEAKNSIAALDAQINALTDGDVPKELTDKRRATIKALYESSVRPFESIVFNPNYMGDSVLNKSENMRTVLRRANEAIVAILRADMPLAKELNILPRYWVMASVGCQGGLGRCRALDFLAGNSDTSVILEAYAWDVDSRLIRLSRDLADKKIDATEYAAQRSQLIKLKFDALKLTTMLRNGSDDSKDRLALLWLMSGTEYGELPESDRSVEGEEQIRTITARITQSLPKRLREESFRTTLLPFIEDKQLWNRFSLKTPRDQRRDFGSIQAGTELMKIACRYYRDNAGMQATVKSSLTQKDATGKPGFLAEIDQYKLAEHAVIFSNMKLDGAFAPTEELFVIDQLFRGHWDSGIAEECWKARRADMTPEQRKADTEKFLKLTQNYIRMRLLTRVIETNKFMSTIFQPTPGREKISSKDIFFRAIDESRQLKDMWSELIERVAILKQFVQSTSGESDKRLRSEEYKKLELMIDSLKTNIKFVSVYPNMLVLAYYLAAKNFNISMPTWYGGTITLDAERVINWIFGEQSDQAARPLFDFGNDSRPILTFESFYAFFYAMKTNTFSTFADADAQASRARSSGEKIISDVNFFAEVIQRYMNTEFLSISVKVKGHEENYSDNQDYRDLLATCKAERERTNPASGDYRVDLTLEDLIERTFIKYEKKEKGAAFEDTYGNYGDLADLRNQLFRKYLFVSTMVELLEDHWQGQLKAAEANPNIKISVENYADAEKRLAEIRQNFDDKLDSIRRYQAFILKRHRELGNCLEVLTDTEERQQNTLVDREVEFLRAVYAGLQEMHAIGERHPEARAQFEATYTAAVNGQLNRGDVEPGSVLDHINSLARAHFSKPGDVRTFDALSYNAGLTYSRWNMLLRARNNLHALNPRVNVSDYPESVLNQRNIYTEANKSDYRINIKFRPEMTEAEFLRAAMSSANSKKFVGWYDNRKLMPLNQRVETLIELYTNETMGVIKAARERGCKPKDERPTCKADAKLKPVTIGEIIDESIRVAKRVHISEYEEAHLRRMNRTAKYAKIEYSRLLLDSRERPHSLLESTYRSISIKNELLAQAQAAVVAFNAMLAVGVNENDAVDGRVDWSKATSGEMIFLAEHDSVRRFTRQNYRPIVMGTIDRVQRFEQAVNCLEEKHFANLADPRNPREISFLYELDLQGGFGAGKVFDPTRDGDGRILNGGRPVYIEGRLKSDFDTLLSDFRKDTKRVFEAREGDADFGVPAAAVNCKALLEK